MSLSVGRSAIRCKACSGQAVPWRGIDFLKCRSCGTVFRTRVPDGQTLEQLYTSSWLQPEDHPEEVGTTNSRLSMEYLANLAQELGIDGLGNLDILDFGAGRGDTLKELQRMGARAVGVEPYGYSKLKEQGLKVYGQLSEIPNSETYDGILCLEVIEHLPDPSIVLRELRKRLKQGGWILFSTPNVGGLNARLMGPRWREAIKPGHLIFLSSGGMEHLLLDSGFSTPKRLHWSISYHTNYLRNVVPKVLEAAGLGGGLRYIAWA